MSNPARTPHAAFRRRAESSPFNPSPSLSFAGSPAHESDSPVLESHQRPRKLMVDNFLMIGRYPVLWLINTARFLRQRIARYRVRPCSRPTADLLVLAGSAFALKPSRVSKRLEDR